MIGLLAACGSDDQRAGPVATSNDTLPPVPETTDEPIATRTGLVLEFGTYGGFTTREFAFQRTPHLVIADGLVITQAEIPEIYPGPLLSQHLVQSITPDGVDSILRAAEQAGLLSEVEYEQDVEIADAGTTTVVVVVDGVTYTHAADALGIGSGPQGRESSPARQALLDFTTLIMGDLAALAGDGTLGDAEPWVPDAYQFFAMPVGDLEQSDIEPTVVDWPNGVALADASECAESDDDAIGEAFSTANQLTFFADEGVTYQVTARPVYPGRTC